MRFEFIWHLLKRFEEIWEDSAIALGNRILFSFHNIKIDTTIVSINNHFNRISDIVAPRFTVPLCICNLSPSFANKLLHRNSIGIPMGDSIRINYPNESPIMDNDVGVAIISQERCDLLNSFPDISFIENSTRRCNFTRQDEVNFVIEFEHINEFTPERVQLHAAFSLICIFGVLLSLLRIIEFKPLGTIRVDNNVAIGPLTIVDTGSRCFTKPVLPLFVIINRRQPLNVHVGFAVINFVDRTNDCTISVCIGIGLLIPIISDFYRKFVDIEFPSGKHYLSNFTINNIAINVNIIEVVLRS